MERVKSFDGAQSSLARGGRRSISSSGARGADSFQRPSETTSTVPDGFYVEVIWHRPGLPDSETLPRDKWQTVDLS